jgi:hypothetical protein
MKKIEKLELYDDNKPLFSTTLREHNWRTQGLWWRIRYLWWEKVMKPVFYTYDPEEQVYVTKSKLSKQ